MKPLPMRQPTREEVLMMLRDCLVRTEAISAEQVSHKVTFESSVNVLDDIDPELDGVHWLQFLNFPEYLWKELDHPRFAKMNVGELCDYLCEHIAIPEIRPLTILGKPGESAGTFRAIQTVLSNAGLHDKIGPSTRIEPLLWNHSKAFNDEVSKLAPGRVPPVIWRNPLGNAAFLIGAWSLLSVFILPVLFGAQSKGFWLVICGLFVTSWLLAGFFHLVPRFWSVSFGGLHDFRDLVNVILDRPQRIVGERGA